jgi:hypothetical protein
VAIRNGSEVGPHHTALAAALALALVLACGGVANGQPAGAGRDAPLLPMAAGNRWVFGTSAGDRFEIRVTEERTERDGSRVVRVDDSGGDYRIVLIAPDQAASLLELHRLGHAPATFDPPLMPLPSGAAPGTRHQHEAALRAFDPSGDSEPQEGTARTELSIGRPEAVRAPAGQFSASLPLEGVIELTWGDGSKHAETFRVWVAPGVGPVRLLVGATPRGASDLRLLEAKVGNLVLPAEP